MITSKIKSIKRVKKKTAVYDIVGVPKYHNLVVNKMVVHNCDEAIRFACVTGDTTIKTSYGLAPIKKLVGQNNIQVYSYNEKTGKEEIKTAGKCVKVKEDTVYEIETEDGQKIRATKEHKFLTNRGWVELRNLENGDTIICV